MTKVNEIYGRSSDFRIFVHFRDSFRLPLLFSFFFFLCMIRTIRGITEHSDPVAHSGSRIDCDTNDIYLLLYSLLLSDRILYY